MSKSIKQMEMDALKETFKGVRDLVVLSVVGLDAIAENTRFAGLRKKNIRLQVVKNSLAKRCSSEIGIKVDDSRLGRPDDPGLGRRQRRRAEQGDRGREASSRRPDSRTR